ncbi:polysaccharide deacetylase [Phenylobacterium sp.]|uniref:polysaccharide deacetylase n=1 Tax=Phenylobacterium sp. TaxID=1871053 RepID=UPI0035B24414
MLRPRLPSSGLALIRLRLELARWRRAGRRAQFWWRDDDVRWRTPHLERLLQIAEKHHAPLTLAAIPDPANFELQGCLERAPVELVQHGVDHQNRRQGPAAGEFPHDWPLERLIKEITTSRVHLPPRALPIFVPPWNDIHPQLPAALAACGFTGWSAWPGAVPTEDGPPRIDAHIDLLRWRGGARFRGSGKMLTTIRQALAERRRQEGWARPVGLLTHHLDHDEPAWAFLDGLLGELRTHPAVEWRPLSALLASRGGHARA